MNGGSDPLRVAWVARSFLDYRVPVFAALNEILDGNLRMFYSADYVPESVAAKAVDVLGDSAIGLPGEWRIGPDDRSGMANARFSLRYQPGLFKQVRKWKPDVLIGDGLFKWTFSAIVYKLLHRTPLVVTYERTGHTERRVQRIRTLYRKLAVWSTDAMACNGRLSVEYVQTLGMPADRVTTGQMAADTEGLRLAVEAVSPEKRDALRSRLDVRGLMLLYVGGLTERKGVEPLLKAWGVVEKSHPGRATLVMIGDGDRRADLEKMVMQEKMACVRFIGQIPYDQLAEYYAAADAFAIPTLEDNWSVVVPEAMACGLPVLCSQYNGCWPELVREGENGWVFDPLNTEDAAAKLACLVDNEQSLASMGEASRAIVSDHTPQQAAEAIYRACQIALDRRRGALK